MSEPCPLWVLLVQKFALGTTSAIELQHLADAAVKSGASTPEMLQLQGLGAMGQGMFTEICSGNASHICKHLPHISSHARCP